MTENERLTIDEIIQHCKRTCENTEMFAIARGQNQDDITSKGYWEHYQVANYLEEIQQYRAIGTVEDVAFYKKCYDEESYEYCGEYGTDNCGCKDRMEHLEKKIAEFEAIGTIDEFKALKEKNTPKKGIPYTSSNNHKFVECPSCHKDMDLYYYFCQHCGQSVDWGKTKT